MILAAAARLIRLNHSVTHRGKNVASRSWRWVWSIALLLGLGVAEGREPALEYRHGLSFVAALRYPAGFSHFNYVNPRAPKGGALVTSVGGSWDSFNPIIGKGQLAAGSDLTGSRNVLYDRLMEPSADEMASQYGRLAEGVALAPDFSWVAYRLRPGARWHDGEPLTVEDIVFTFEAMKAHGSPVLKTALRDVARVEILGPREFRYVMEPGRVQNASVALLLGQLIVLPKHYWSTRDVSKTTVEPPLGSGPYRIGRFIAGRRIEYERVPDYWGRDLAVNRGRYNWDTIAIDYFRDANVQREAHLSGETDIREEGQAKSWALTYNFPGRDRGLFVRELIPLSRAEGVWWAVFYNLRLPRFQDARVREALLLLYDWRWQNRVLSFGFYKQARSLFNNSPMEHKGLPSAEELKLLEPFRDQLPERVFTQQFDPPETSGYGFNREHLAKAIELFREAGWVIRDGVMVNAKTGEPFTVEAILVSPELVRTLTPFMHRLRSVGIDARARAPEVSNWQYRMRTRDFEMGMMTIVPSNTPGYELRNLLHSDYADRDYGGNWPGIKNPVVDFLVEKIIAASTESELLAATRALDRVVLWNFYFIPRAYRPGARVVYWDRYGRPETEPLQRTVWFDTWWIDPEKSRRVDEGISALDAE